MSAPAKCPRCGTKLQPHWESCPNCPMSFLDAPPEKSMMQSDAFRNYVLPVVLLAGFGGFVWSLGQYLLRSGVEGTKSISTEVVPAVKVSPEAFSARRPSVDEETGNGIVSVMPASTNKQKVVGEWKLRGSIFNLVTLKPVPSVSMVFTDNTTNARAQILTDARGRYRVILPPLSRRGYLVTLSKSGFAKAYLNPWTEGIREMRLERRVELARELATSIIEPASIEPTSEEPLMTDFYLAPERP